MPKDLKEVSGNETIRNSNLIWMLNDGGNESKIYAVSEEGKIKREVYIKNKNHEHIHTKICFYIFQKKLINKQHNENRNSKVL